MPRTTLLAEGRGRRLPAAPVALRRSVSTTVALVSRSVPAGAAPRTPLAATALALAAVLLLGFGAYTTTISAVVHARGQRLGYAELRQDLANATAPVGPSRDGALLPLGTPVALLEGPGLREVVREGTTSTVLRDGPGHRRDTVLPGQAGTAVVLGRRAAFGGPFSGVTSLPVGARITATTGLGTATYRVTRVRRAGDVVPGAPAAGQGRLTLVTAAGLPFLPSGAVRVDAELVGPAQPSAGRAAGVLPHDEQALQGEPDAALPLLLWSQLLLLAAVSAAWARRSWGARQAWLVGTPVLAGLALAVADSAARLLPNLL